MVLAEVYKHISLVVFYGFFTRRFCKDHLGTRTRNRDQSLLVLFRMYQVCVFPFSCCQSLIGPNFPEIFHSKSLCVSGR